MIIGEYKHSFDEKKRISLPIKFRKEMGKKIIMTQGLDNCLFVYSINEWQKISAKLASLSLGQSSSRSLNRFLLGGAVEIEVDSVGRVLIPEHLRAFAGLETKVIFTGVHNRIEIWNDNRWFEYKKKVAEEANDLAEKLGDIGAI